MLFPDFGATTEGRTQRPVTPQLLLLSPPAVGNIPEPAAGFMEVWCLAWLVQSIGLEEHLALLSQRPVAHLVASRTWIA